MYSIYIIFDDGKEGYYHGISNGRIQYGGNRYHEAYEAQTYARAKAQAEILCRRFSSIYYIEIIEEEE